MAHSAVIAVCLCIFLGAAAVQGGQPEKTGMNLVTRGRAVAVIVLGRNATPLERHAAAELARYVRAMSGAALPIVTDDRWQAEREEAAILIGRAETHPLIADLVRQGRVRLSAEDPGLDGFILKTLPGPASSPRLLVMGGSSDRGTLYAVYHLLERFCSVGFHWDGDYVPVSESLALPVCDVSERPRFSIRQYLQACAFGYTTTCWEWEDWKREIDWMAKRYQNTMMMDWTHPEAGRIAEYARMLGIRLILPGAGLGEVSDEFRQQHPDVRYVKMQWGEDPAYWVIHPSDPMFVRRSVEAIRQAIASHGTDHLYNVDPYPEQTVFLPPEEIETMRTEFGRAVAESIRQADPEGVWYASGWALLAPPWPEPTAKAFLEAIPADRFYICDIWAEENPIYPRFDYFHGRDWGFAVLHSFGGDDTLRGDLAGLIGRVQEVARDPRADRCVAFYINPEIIHYNRLYFELAAKLSWRPEVVELEGFLRDYALHRYGKESAPTMLECLRRLARSVYSSSSRATEPAYQHRLRRLETDPGRYPHLDDLEEALRLALRERDRQRDNRLYTHDLVDILRQYLAELSNLHLERLYQAFSRGEREALEREARTVDRLLSGLEQVLATRDEYRLDRMVEKTRRLGRSETTLRDSFLTFAGTPWLLDYSSKDVLELVQFYYRPRVEAFIAALRAALQPVRSRPTTPNVVLNPGFEEGEGSQPAQWGTGFVHQGGTAVRGRELGSAGDYCGRLDTPGGDAYANLYQDVAVRAGEIYCLSGRVKVQGGCTVQFAADLRTGEWPQTNYAIEYTIGGSLQGDHDWTPVSGYFAIQVPSGGKEGDPVTLRLYCRLGGGAGTAWFDEVSLQPVAAEDAPVVRWAQLEAEYERIEKEWLERPLQVEPKGRADPVRTVREVFATVSRGRAGP